MAEINKTKKTEDIIKYRQTYYQANKERILKNMSENIFCECCFCHTSKQALNKHNRSNKHIRNKELFDLKLRIENNKI